MLRATSLFVLVSCSALATPAGISGFSGKSVGTTCTSCHTGGAAPTVMLAGPNTLMPGATGNYTVTVTGGPGQNAGVDAALGGANSGQAVLTAGTGTKLLNGEVVQSAAASMTGGSASFAFTVKAPMTNGVFTVSVAGLSGNNNSDPSGDGVGTATLSVTVGTGPATGTDAGTAGPVDAGTVTPKPDAGTVAAMPAPTGSRQYIGGPVSAGNVEGEAGCSSIGGAPMLIIAAMLLMALLVRRPVRVAPRLRTGNSRPKN